MQNSKSSDRVKLFGLNNLLLENDLLKLEKGGLSIGHAQTITSAELVDAELFELDIRKKAHKMAKFYELYFCLENSIRKLILDVLSDKHSTSWWDMIVPDKVKNEVTSKQKQEKDTPMSIRSEDPLAYTSFGELMDIFNKNWSDFSDVIRSQRAMQKTLSQFNDIRNVIAHSCELNDDEILRFTLLVKDWLRIVN
ncbi:MAG: hypothetical protein LBE13_07415 [Bacteroidales bacterium]|jgi:hypothetical protein|nr:hypothetical protein [Bacteroidales bacterium]